MTDPTKPRSSAWHVWGLSTAVGGFASALALTFADAYLAGELPSDFDGAAAHSFMRTAADKLYWLALYVFLAGVVMLCFASMSHRSREPG